MTREIRINLPTDFLRKILHSLGELLVIYFITWSVLSMSFGDNSFGIKSGLAKMLKGGVIMDVVNVEQALIAEAAGAVAVMALERIPADIRFDGGVARMSDPDMILKIKSAVTIPVMAKVSHRLFHVPTVIVK